MSVAVWIGVGLLGGVGALARFLFDGAVGARAGLDFPVGTLAVNASGAFTLGMLSGAGLAGDAYLLAGTAALGSYTTFSTWMLETHRLGEEGAGRALLANVALSAAVGLLAALAGRAIGELL